ncbi:hypothetical protein NQ315_006021 [Exocentrus adspersus]|uniref:Uncharacterized protein n=1 Tax=Exocentrus adspersus TaxID=1586481 RepID=A0AAV8VAN3_9CUCU|nr:hypothetical protein NQ315_006021 [Exocentrus adspersus]
MTTAQRRSPRLVKDSSFSDMHHITANLAIVSFTNETEDRYSDLQLCQELLQKLCVDLDLTEIELSENQENSNVKNEVYHALLAKINKDPTTYKEAIRSDNREKWKTAVKEEFKSMKYIAMSKACQEAMALNNSLKLILDQSLTPVKLWCDNKAAQISAKHDGGKRLRYMTEIREHYITKESAIGKSKRITRYRSKSVPPRKSPVLPNISEHLISSTNTNINETITDRDVSIDFHVAELNKTNRRLNIKQPQYIALTRGCLKLYVNFPPDAIIKFGKDNVEKLLIKEVCHCKNSVTTASEPVLY